MDKYANSRRLGVLGGTFDPVHSGHLQLAETARLLLRLDAVLFVPCGNPPHKQRRAITPAGERCKMLRLAIQDNQRFSVCTLELKHAAPSYTVDTLVALRQGYARANFFFLVGSDAGPEFFRWRQPERILQLCTMVVAARPRFPMSEVLFAHRLLGGSFLDVSSSYLRTAFKRGLPARYYLPERVYRYITRKGLYGSAGKNTT